MQFTQNNQNAKNDSECEISVDEIVNFLLKDWKKLLIAAVIGATLGLSGWFVLGSYSSSYVLFSGNSKLNNSLINPFEVVTWKFFQKSLPILAHQIVDENKAPSGKISFYKVMSDEDWWQKNVVPTYAITKADFKNFSLTNKDLESTSTTILYLTVTANGPSRKQAEDNARLVIKFIRSGGAYIQIRALLSGYENQVINGAADLHQKITSTKYAMNYQQDLIRKLEDLQKRFPGNKESIQMTLDFKDEYVKFLPLQTQIIAANRDLNDSKERVVRLEKKLSEIALVKIFLDQAFSLEEKTFDGLVLSKQLLEIESSLRARLSRDDSVEMLFLDKLHAELLEIDWFFNRGLDTNAQPFPIERKGMLISIVSGLVIAPLLVCLALFRRRIWQILKTAA